MRWRLLVFAMACAGLGTACSSAPPPPLQPADPAAACLAGLDQRHITYERLQDWHTPEGCGIQTAVRVKQSATQWNHSGLLTCAMASRLWDFETQVVMPAAQRNFGRGVRKMWNAGTYDCRNRRSDRPQRMSEHAYGRAIDVTGFELDDGTPVSVLRDWRGKGAKSVFLHQVAEEACRIFNVVITPDSNALHRDHFHLDIGPHKYCIKPAG